MDKLDQIKKELRRIADPEKAKLLQRYFKTRRGEYGEGDVFLGITVPKLREIAKKYYSLDMRELKELIQSGIHEERMICLFVLINKYKTTNHKKIIFHFYIKNTKYINNWDLVDLSAPNIVGEHLLNYRKSSGSIRSLNGSSVPSGNTSSVYKSGSIPPAAKHSSKAFEEIMKRPFREGFRPIDTLLSLAKSENVWERRIAVIATFRFIKENQFDESLKLAKILLQDEHDLIQKAVGWMLREIGKRNLKTETKFLDKYYRKMPRTMLRYAIEKFPEEIRASYLKGN